MIRPAVSVRKTCGPSPETWAEVASDYRRRNPITPLSAEEARKAPELDDPHFEAKLHTAAAPLEMRKALVVELWNSLGIEDRLRFLRRVAKPSELRSAAA